MRHTLVLLALSLVAVPSGAALPSAPGTPPPATRASIPFDFDWRFRLGDMPGAQVPAFDDTSWRLLDVPHDWSAEGEYDQNNPGGAVSGWLPTGIGWYRKSFEVTPAMLQGNVSVQFDGVFMDSTTWVNGERLGEEPYGFMSFAYDLTTHLHPGRNTIAVRVNNLLQPAARWYTGSGIYGHVNLLTTRSTHVAPWSTFVRTASLDTVHGATLNVSTAVEGPQATAVGLRFSVLDASGKLVASAASQSGSTPALDHPLTITVPHPVLWSPDTPILYTLRTELLQGKTVIDSEDTAFGIRTAVFDPQRGFLLNGKVLKLRGIGDHWYGGPMGTAIPDGILERRLQLLKDMGVNALRTAHNPHPPIYYQLCDRMGFLVIDEIYDGWHRKAKNEYADRFYTSQWHHDVENWIRRDRNHASIFAWSIGNETGLNDDNHMSEYIRTFDSTRPTTGGMITTGVDVSGWNGPGETPGVLERFHAEHPTVPIILTEEPHTLQTRGYYRVRTWWRDWKHVDEFEPYGTQEIFFDGDPWYNSSYDNAIVRNNSRQSWLRTAATPWIAGEFRWHDFDYIGEAAYKGGRWPVRAENFGIIDLASIPKDDYFLYQAFWTSRPMVHLLPHWTHRDMEGVVIPVVAYSNQPTVELFLNEKSLGLHKPGPLGDFLWKVPYTPGNVRAVAYDSAGRKMAEDHFVTASDPTGIALEADNTALRPNRTDDSVLTFRVVDKSGTMVPWSMNTISFQVNGPVHLLGYENGDPIDVTAAQAPHRNAFYGMGRGFFQSTEQDGPIDVLAAGILGDPYMHFENGARLRTVAIAASRISLRGVLPPSPIQIHYTLDGSTPTAESPLYTAPFGIHDETLVRAMVLYGNRPPLLLSQWFRRLDPPLVTDPRWATDSRVDPLQPNGSPAAAGMDRGKGRQSIPK